MRTAAQFTDPVLQIERGNAQIIIDAHSHNWRVAPVRVEAVIHHRRKRGEAAALIQISIFIKFQIDNFFRNAIVLVNAKELFELGQIIYARRDLHAQREDAGDLGKARHDKINFPCVIQIGVFGNHAANAFEDSFQAVFDFET